MSMMHCSLLSLGCVFGFAPAEETILTANRALKIAQRRLRPEVRSKLLGVTSPRTDETLTPKAWRFVFQDLETSGHSRVVTVATKASSEHPETVAAFNSIKSDSVEGVLEIPQNKLFVDSDQILEKAREVSKLKGIRSASYRLVQPRSTKEPIWLLHFYAEGDEPVARFRVGAKTGSIQLVNGDNKAD